MAAQIGVYDTTEVLTVVVGLTWFLIFPLYAWLAPWSRRRARHPTT